MKRSFRFFLSAMLAVSLAACAGQGGSGSAASGGSEGVSGTFTGEAVGIGGEDNPVKVTLTIENNVIVDVKAEGAGETEGIGSKALETLPGLIVAGNTLDVDAVTGATITSNAILEAAGKALESAGLTAADLVPKEGGGQAAAEDIVKDVDVVIIGAGGAGMTAAISAADAGKTVLIVESQELAGGNSVRSTGGMNAADTPYQDDNTFAESAGVEKTLESAKDYADNETITALAAAVAEQYAAYQANPEGYFDSVELMQLDTMIGGKAKNDPELVRTLAEQSGPAIEWLETIGATLHSVGAFGGASVMRIHRPVNDEGKTAAVGAYIVPILEKTVADRGVEVLYNTTATKILMADGKAVGIEAEGKAGNKVTVNAKAVVIASGGFGANLEMVSQLNPALDGFCTTNAAGAQGQGIALAQEAGADVVDMDQIQIHPTVHLDPDGNAHLITEGLRGDGAILVNKEGKRFFDEVNTRDAVSAAELEQTDGVVWLIVDQAMADASSVIQGYIKAGYTVTGDTPEALAEAMGVDPAAFAETLKTWQGYWENKSDPEFNRTSFAAEINLSSAPYYALTVTPGIHHTMGGIKINSSCEVISTEGQPIAGLFAAGEVTGGVHGANRLGGNAVADFTVFGKIAGQSAAAFAE